MASFFRRPFQEYRVAGQSLFATLGVRVLLSCLPVRSIRRGVRFALSADTPLAPASRLSMERLVRCAARGARFSPLPATCLVNALVTEALLNRHGYPVGLRVGVQRRAGAFSAHAWLEFQGSVVVGGPITVVEQYTPFPEIERLLT